MTATLGVQGFRKRGTASGATEMDQGAILFALLALLG